MIQKRVAAIHDISCLGKCSLTVALPVLSCAGVEVCVLPTAVLSTHTGGFKNFTYRDLTCDIMPIAEHWKSLDIKFDALYSGYLGSFEQIELLDCFFDMFKKDETLILIDPVMGDNGSFYTNFSQDFAASMANLCHKADIIVPNITEATQLLNEPYRSGCYTKDYIEGLLHRLSELGPKQIVLTGVYFDCNLIGSASYDSSTGAIEYSLMPKLNGMFHGTGDIFASALLSGILKGFSLSQSASIATQFAYECIALTLEQGNQKPYCVNFEAKLPYFIELLSRAL